MKPRYRNLTIRALTSVVALGWALPASLAMAAQTDEQAEDADIAPIVLDEAAGRIDAPPTLPDEEPVDEEIAPIVLEEQTLFEDPVYLEDIDAEELEGAQLIESNSDKLRRLFVLYLDAVAEQGFDEADMLAKQIVELSIQVHGLDSQESASALTNLAIAQHGIQDYESAILNYTAAIGIIERIEDRLNRALINPLRGLGAAQLAAGRPDLAKDAYDRAVHISHVNDGPHNMEQIETLQSLAETYMSVGEVEEAADMQKRIFYLQARNVDQDSPEILPALRTRAEWHHKMSMYDQERFTWRRIISVIEQEKGKESLDLIDPLTQLGNSFLFISYTDPMIPQQASATSGEIYLKRALRIAEKNPDASWEMQAETIINLGDYLMLTERASRAFREYRDAWKLLSADEDRLDARKQKLEAPVALQDIYPPRMLGGDPSVPLTEAPPGYETATVEFEFTVSSRGRPIAVEIANASPPGLDAMYEQVGRQIRGQTYRPRFEDGDPVETEHMTYTHEFYYREADLPELAPGPEAEPEPAQSDDGAMLTENAAPE